MRYSNTVELVQQAGTKYKNYSVQHKNKNFPALLSRTFFLAGCFYKTAEKSAFILLIPLLFMFAFLSYN